MPGSGEAAGRSDGGKVVPAGLGEHLPGACHALCQDEFVGRFPHDALEAHFEGAAGETGFGQQSFHPKRLAQMFAQVSQRGLHLGIRYRIALSRAPLNHPFGRHQDWDNGGVERLGRAHDQADQAHADREESDARIWRYGWMML